jgi:hypothetical protein
MGGIGVICIKDISSYISIKAVVRMFFNEFLCSGRGIPVYNSQKNRKLFSLALVYAKGE